MIKTIIRVPEGRMLVFAERGAIEMIRTVIRMETDMVMVLDEWGEQLPEYQGEYGIVKERILADAPMDAVFADGFTRDGELLTVPRGEW